MKKTRLFAMLLTSVLLIGSGTGCSTDSENTAVPDADVGVDSGESEVLTVAFSQCGNQNNWKVVQTNDMKEKIEASDTNIFIRTHRTIRQNKCPILRILFLKSRIT